MAPTRAEGVKWRPGFCGFHELSDNDSDEGQSWS